jgi:hypothetical protein
MSRIVFTPNEEATGYIGFVIPFNPPSREFVPVLQRLTPPTLNGTGEVETEHTVSGDTFNISPPALVINWNDHQQSDRSIVAG